jgi:hypothetical protein
MIGCGPAWTGAAPARRSLIRTCCEPGPPATLPLEPVPHAPLPTLEHAGAEERVRNDERHRFPVAFDAPAPAESLTLPPLSIRLAS